MKKIVIVFIGMMLASTVFLSGCEEDDNNNNTQTYEEEVPNITGDISIKSHEIYISLGGDTLDADDAMITITDPNNNDNMINTLTGQLAENFNFDNYFKWNDFTRNNKIGYGDYLKIYNDGGLDTGIWYIKIIQKSTDEIVYYSGEIEVEEEEETLQITGIIEVKDQAVTISLAGDVLAADDASLIVWDSSDHVYTRSSITADEVLGFGSENNFIWMDQNGDDNIGPGDTLRLYGDNGLDVGDWYMRIKQKSTGDPVYESGKIEI